MQSKGKLNTLNKKVGEKFSLSFLDFSDPHVRHVATLSLVIVGMLGLAMPWLWTYLSWNMGSALAVLVGLLIIRVKEPGVRSHRYGWVALFFGGIHLLSGLQVALLMCIGACIWWAIEVHVGKVSYLPLMIWGLISPAVSSWLSALTFPLRLEMGLLTAQNLQKMGMDVVAEGSHFMVNGQLYAVEEACVGIHTLLTSLILMTLIFAYFEKRRDISFSLIELGLGYALAALVSLIANLLRIHLLVIFRSPPQTFSHEVLGILTIIWSILLPMYLLVWGYTQVFRRSKMDAKHVLAGLWGYFNYSQRFSFFRISQYIFMLSVGLYTFSYNYSDSNHTSTDHAQFEIAGWQHERVFTHISKYSKEGGLIYIKPPVSPWRADHSPLICWKGSGFEFSHIQRMKIAGQEVLAAKIIKEETTLYTCWWYDNGASQSTQQWDWRWQTLEGAAPFYMISVTADSPEDLVKYVKDFGVYWTEYHSK